MVGPAWEGVLTRPSRLRRVAALAAVIGIGLLTGCTESQDRGGGAGTDRSGDTPGVRSTDLTTTVGDPKEFPVPGSGEDTVTVGVISLEVKGKTQILSLVFTPHFGSKGDDDSVSLSAMLGRSDFSPRLIDQKNLEVYTPLDSSTTSSSDATTVNGRPLYTFAVFTAPQNSAVDFELQIDTSWTPLHVRAEKK